MTLFELVAKLGLDTGEFTSGISESKSAMNSLSSVVNGVTGKIKDALVKLGVGTAIAKIGKLGLSFNSQIEDYTANFKVMLGSYEAAQAKVAEIQEMAAKTPFEIAGLADATQTLLAFQVPAAKTNKMLQMLGDVALGNKGKLSSLALVYGQVASAGKLTGQDLLQFINQGFNPLNYIAERTGESMETVRKRMSEGKVTVDEVTQAFEDATSEGGLFYKGMDEASKTLSGLFSTLKDDATAMVGKLTAPFAKLLKSDVLPAAQGAIEKISAALDKLFGSSESAKESLFGTGEGAGKEGSGSKSESASSWMERLMATWTDGKAEDDATVKAFVESFTQNTATIIEALKARKTELESTGASTEALDRSIAQLNKYDAEITALIEKRKGKNFTEEDKKRLEEITAAKTTLEQSLLENQGMTAYAESMGAVKTNTSGLADIITGIGDAVAWCVDNWNTLKSIAKAGISLAIGLKTSKTLLSILTAAGVGATTAGPIGAGVAVLGAIAVDVILNWPTDEELQAGFTNYQGEHQETTSKFVFFCRTKLGLPTATEWAGWAKSLWTSLETEAGKIVESGKALFAQMFGLPADFEWPTIKGVEKWITDNITTPASNGWDKFKELIAKGITWPKIDTPAWVTAIGETLGKGWTDFTQSITSWQWPPIELPQWLTDFIDKVNGATKAVKALLGMGGEESPEIPKYTKNPDGTTRGENASGFGFRKKHYSDKDNTLKKQEPFTWGQNSSWGKTFNEPNANTGAAENVNGLSSAAEAAASGAEAAASGLEGVSSASGKAAGDVGGLAGAAKGAASVVSSFVSGLSSAKTAATNFAAKINGLEIKAPSISGVTLNAKGGIFKKASLLGNGNVVGEAGVEAALPLKTLWDEMGARFDSAFMKYAYAGGFDYDALADAVTARPIVYSTRIMARKSVRNTSAEIAARQKQIARGKGGR